MTYEEFQLLPYEKRWELSICKDCIHGDICTAPDRPECDDYIPESAIDRLAELEDKIKNGTLIELPCKVGDKVYRICGTPKRKFIKEKICWGICFNNFGVEIHTDGAEDIISDNIFLTKAEAEARLKEQQNDR